MSILSANAQREQIIKKFRSPQNVKYLSTIAKKIRGNIFNTRTEVNNYQFEIDPNELNPSENNIIYMLKKLNTNFIKELGQKIIDVRDSNITENDNDLLIAGEIHTSNDTYKPHIIRDWGPDMSDLEFVDNPGGAFIYESKTEQKYPNRISKNKIYTKPIELGLYAIGSLETMHTKYGTLTKPTPKFIYF